MAITTDLSDPIGEIRLLVGDTVEGDGIKPDGSNFTDAEIQYFYDEENHVMKAAARICETLANLWAVHPDFEADGLRVNRGRIAESWANAAQRFRMLAGAKITTVNRTDAYSKEADS